MKIFYLWININKKTIYLTSTKIFENAQLPNFVKIHGETRQKGY